ncbi:MAG: 2-amino-4-hydroxy-6-hydroxymethyldihydropteridine diphosphokinase [Gemmatimonadales bacterium]
MSPQVRACIALGTNLGDREGYLAQGRAGLAALPDTVVLRLSRVEETAPLGEIPQAPYLNQMALIQTGLPARTLLDGLLAIERAAGRLRGGAKWGPRTLDLDLVRYGEQVIDEPGLTVPHPGLADRDFWRRELEELDIHGR